MTSFIGPKNGLISDVFRQVSDGRAHCGSLKQLLLCSDIRPHRHLLQLVKIKVQVQQKRKIEMAEMKRVEIITDISYIDIEVLLGDSVDTIETFM